MRLFASLLVLSAVLGLGCSGPEEGLSLKSAAVLVEDDGAGGVPSLPMPESPVAGAPTGSQIVHGMVEPVRFEKVDFTVPGVVEDVLVKRGQEVKRGQVLATLETKDRQARLDDVKERYRSARRRLPAGRSTRGGELPDYLKREMEVRLAEVEERARYRITDQKDFQKKVSRGADEEEMRDMVLDIAQRRNEKPRTHAIKRAHAEQLSIALVDDLSSRMRTLEDSLNGSTLKSPLDGVVVAMTVRPGKVWNTRSEDAAFEIVDPTALVVRAEVRRSRADTMQLREMVWIELDGEQVVQAGVKEISRNLRQRVDPDTGQPRSIRMVTFSLPATLPAGVDVGSEARIALQP
jgi:multidrug efflux pump subunit AcrA (membrane-fusion protein)